MPDVDLAPVLAATLVAFVLGATYYALLAGQLAPASDAAADAEGMPPWKVAVELARCLILAAVVAGLAAEADVGGWASGVALGAALWVGFPFVLWTGAVVHEGTPWRLAAVHAGDWLVKLVVVAAIVSVWR